MDGLHPDEAFSSFAAAHKHAQQIAKRYRSETGIQREEDYWRVHVSPFIREVDLHGELPECMTHEPDPHEDEEGRGEAFEEVMSNWDDFSRSDESGWFYED
jgi:hypothetical protein